jgi:arsenical pump membrane protein
LLQFVWSAVARGFDVYAFLIGIMTLAEIGRACGVFDWMASGLLDGAANRRARLFTLVYALGTLVTIALSNDTTAVVLTPAILAAVKRTKAAPLPYVYACAFIANAASFVLPISNPANLVVFQSQLPPLLPWLQSFGLASIAAIVVTYAVLRVRFAGSLHGSLEYEPTAEETNPARGLATGAIVLSALALVIAAALHADVGVTALVSAAVSLTAVSARHRSVLGLALRRISWHIIALVAVLFVLVSAVDRTGALSLLRELFLHRGVLLAGFVLTVLDNVVNNLPVGLAAGTALAGAHVSSAMRAGAVIAVDLGPNLSVSGSLATLLWLAALKRADVRVTFGQFLGVGAVVTVPALAAALLLAR